MGAILDWLAATTAFDLMCSLFFLPRDWYPSINNFIQSVTLFKFNFESKGQLTKKGPDPNKRSNQLSVEMLNKRSKADFAVGIIYNFYQYFGRHGLPSSARVLHTMRLYHDYLQDYHDYRDYLNQYPPRPALGTTTTATTTTTVTTMATETTRTTETTTRCVQYDYQHYQHYQRYPRLSALFKTTTAISATVTISSSSIVVAATSPSDVKIVTIVTTHCASLSWQFATCHPCCYLNCISLGEGKYLSRDTSNLK